MSFPARPSRTALLQKRPLITVPYATLPASAMPVNTRSTFVTDGSAQPIGNTSHPTHRRATRDEIDESSCDKSTDASRVYLVLRFSTAYTLRRKSRTATERATLRQHEATNKRSATCFFPRFIPHPYPQHSMNSMIDVLLIGDKKRVRRCLAGARRRPPPRGWAGVRPPGPPGRRWMDF